MKSQFALLTIGLAMAATIGAPPEEKPVWHKDWPAAQRLAKASQKPIFALLVCQH